MSESHGGLELLVATGDQSLGRAVTDAIEAAERTSGAEHVETGSGALAQSKKDHIDGAVVDARVGEPPTVVERLADERDLPVVVLTDPTGDGDTLDRALEAGVTDVFPRTPTSAQYELVVERIADESTAAQPSTDGATEEKPYREVFENVSDGLVVHEPDTGEMLDVNEQFCEMTGYSRDELVGETVDLVTADDEDYSYERAKERIQRARDEGELLFEWQERDKNGHTYPVEVHLTLVELHGAERVLASVRDITERKRREREYEQIFNNVQGGITINDPETGEIIEVNDSFCDLLGYSREDILEMGVQGVSASEKDFTMERAREMVQTVVETGEPRQVEWAVETSTGETRWLSVRGTPAEIGGERRYLSLTRDVTERRRREREYEQIFNGVNDSIVIQDPETAEPVDANETFLDRMGYDDVAEIREKGFEGLSAVETGYTRERAQELCQRVIETGEPEVVEWQQQTKSGDTRWIEGTVDSAVIRGKERILSIQRDITERKRRERAIRALQDATGRLQTAQTRDDVARIAVETASDALGLPMAICWFHDSESGRLEPAAATDAVREAGLVSGLSPDRYEYEVFVADEVTEYAPSEHAPDNPLETSVLLPLGEHGLVAAGTYEDTEADRTVLDVAKALADHVTTALDRVEREQAVRESERRFRLIAERIDEVIYLAEPDFSEVLYVNPAYEEIYGQPVETLYSDATAFFEAIDERDREAFESEFETMIAEIDAGDPAESYEFEFRLRRPSGEVRWVHTTGYVVELPGEKRRFVGIVDDITERKRREQRLQVFNRILRHNLRNQLDVIRSHAEVLADQTTDSHADQIIAAVDELAATGARARETDRIISMGDTPARIDLSAILRETVEATQSKRNHVAVSTDVPQRTSLRTNREAATIAVESALENALEHAESTVTVTVEDSPDGYVVTIDDDGPGIPQEELVPIETGTETNLQHGRGLGLWQLRWSVDKLNGELSFDTTGGTTVRITIPDRDGSSRPD